MAKVLLIYPPWYLLMGSGSNEIPIGLCYIAGYLNKRGHEAWVFNADHKSGLKYLELPGRFYNNFSRYQQELKEFNNPIWQRIYDQIGRMKPDIVGIHFKTAAFESVQHVASIAHQSHPDCLTVVGGPHPSIMPVESASIPEVDVAVQGEGEVTMCEIANRIPFDYKNAIPGAYYKNPNGEIIGGGRRALMMDLDVFGEPDRDHILDRKKYSSAAFGPIFSARGCPFSCTYCSSKGIWTSKVRYRSAESVVDEVSKIKRIFGTRYYHFLDDTFTSDRNRTIKICDLLRDRVPHIAWKCDTRADLIDFELAKRMHQAGCVQANIGVESGSDRILKMIKKGAKKEQILRGVEVLKQNKISITIYIMIGFPTETIEEAEDTVNYGMRLKPDNLVLSIVTPYPGTEIYHQAKSLNLLPSEIPYSYYFHQSPFMGFMGTDENSFKSLSRRLLKQVDKYNGNLLNKANRFRLIFARCPIAAFEKLKSYVYK
jgi:radical SAM superfamily enzyme YgiQ (UPF0313 family)